MFSEWLKINISLLNKSSFISDSYLSMCTIFFTVENKFVKIYAQYA